MMLWVGFAVMLCGAALGALLVWGVRALVERRRMAELEREIGRKPGRLP